MRRKLYLIGLDGMMYPMYERFAREGVIPNIQRLAERGMATEVYCSLPSYTPTNWATLMTGAHTGTHTALRWYIDLPTPQDTEKSVSSFVGQAIKAETVFEAASRAGLKSVAFHYPAASPARAEGCYVVDGYGHPAFGSSPFEVTPCLTYTNVPAIPNTYSVELKEAEGWENLPESRAPHLEFPVEVVTKVEGENRTFHALAIAGMDGGYDTVVVCTARDGRTEIARSSVGEWSDWCHEPFVVQGKRQDATLRFKTVELVPDASRIRFYRSQVMMVDEFCEPKALGHELVERFGPYLEHASDVTHFMGATDFETSLEEMEYQCQWVACAGKYMMEEKDCSLLYTHIHMFDYINHHHGSGVDPVAPGHVPEEAEEHMEIYRQCYKVADRMIGTLMDGLDEDTGILIVSDHGVVPDRRCINIRKFLYEKGLLAVKDPAKGLRTWVDEETGRCPIALALPKHHAPLVGFWSDQCGDVVFFDDDGYMHGYMGEWRSIKGNASLGEPEWYGAHHGPQLPTSRTDYCSIMAFLLASAPGIKKGYERPVNDLGYIHMTSIAPLVCHLLGIEPPAQAQGALPRDLLEGHPSVMERGDDYPDWEPGTGPEGWGDRVWIQKDMFDFVSYEEREGDR
jgi:predicted AlkP superfamily phosphohydrolase/phosphomutase